MNTKDFNTSIDMYLNKDIDENIVENLTTDIDKYTTYFETKRENNDIEKLQKLKTKFGSIRKIKNKLDKIVSDGSSIVSDGSSIVSDGSSIVKTVDGSSIVSDGSSIVSDGSSIVSDGSSIVKTSDKKVDGSVDNAKKDSIRIKSNGDNTFQIIDVGSTEGYLLTRKPNECYVVDYGQPTEKTPSTEVKSRFNPKNWFGGKLRTKKRRITKKRVKNPRPFKSRSKK